MALYELHRYLLMTLDPVHIGTGGYRLGRVDNSIAREAGTKLPKIPGTSLHGAIRSYAARIYETPDAAGLNHDKIKKPETNAVCYTFGYIKKGSNENNESAKSPDKNDESAINPSDVNTKGQNDDKSAKGFSGVVNISDAHILFFPVYSMNGTVWVTTQEKIEEAGFSIKGTIPFDIKEVLYTGNNHENRMNLGWLMLNIKNSQISIEKPEDKEQKDGKPEDKKQAEINKKRWNVIEKKIVIVHSSLFSQVVNSNLEVRTSVAIDPERGAADDGALFTYEALPRATFLTMDVVIDDYRNQFEDDKKKFKTPLDVVEKGLNLLEYLGVGGMGTRGFGRIANVSSWEVANG